MSVRSKVSGAALAVAAPEAAGAAKAAGAGKGRRPPVPDPRKTAPGSEAARQRQAVEDIKARRKPEDPPADEHEHQGGDDEHQGDDGGRFAPFAGMQAPATGGGFVLGLMVWAAVRAYIGTPGRPSGWAGVKALGAAKFLNKPVATTGGGGK